MKDQRSNKRLSDDTTCNGEQEKVSSVAPNQNESHNLQVLCDVHKTSLLSTRLGSSYSFSNTVAVVVGEVVGKRAKSDTEPVCG